HYLVVGGNFTNQLKKNKERIVKYNKLTGIYPESRKMVNKSKEIGLSNVSQIPNFTVVKWATHNEKLQKTEVIKFVYLARITPEKGSDLILDACEELNKQGLQSKYLVHFYGFFHPDPDNYENKFMLRLNKLPNLNYLGF